MNKDSIVSNKRQIPIEEWRIYGLQGISVPVTIPVYGNSMEPLIRIRKDFVTIIPISSLDRPIEEGDIVLFQRADGKFVLHRLYKTLESEKKVITWGDNCIVPDRPIHSSDIWGIAISVKKGNRIISLDTCNQREYGKRWMNGSIQRKTWFAYKRIKRIFSMIKNTLK